MVGIIFWTILLYLLYRFVFGFLIPVISAGRQMRMRVREMQEQMKGSASNQQGGNGQENYRNTTATNTTSSSSKGDYIDFEEVK